MSTNAELWRFDVSEGGHFSKPVPVADGQGMAALRAMFPEGRTDGCDFVLFSTSGVHGSYRTIEEDYAIWETGEASAGITFLVVQPRLVAMRYGKVMPENDEDYEFLKSLREASWSLALDIGRKLESDED